MANKSERKRLTQQALLSTEAARRAAGRRLATLSQGARWRLASRPLVPFAAARGVLT
jgi:hypothetical protein